MPIHHTTPAHIVDPESGCWLWQRAHTNAGYGVMWRDRRLQLAHRVYYTDHIGEIPAGLEIDHRCRTPQCVNPAHLEPVTGWENNVGRGNSPAAVNARKVECIRGHSLESAYRRPNGGRKCRVCAREKERQRRERARHDAVE